MLCRPGRAAAPRIRRGAAWFLRARLRTRVALVLAVLAVLAVGATIAVTLSAPAAPDVVPYPTVTGPLGDHLKDLQKSVEP